MKGAHKRGFKSERQASAARRAVMGMVWHEELGWVAERTYERIAEREAFWAQAHARMTAEINAEAQRREGGENGI